MHTLRARGIPRAARARPAAGAVLLLAVAVACAAQAPADPVAVVLDDGELNGTYTAISDGQWAKTNEVYRDETSVTSTWTISSTCSTFMDCAGRVSSDQGWSADIRMQGGMWKVVHQVADWEKCADGMTAPGEQTFTFFKVDAATHVGWDKTIGPSGACGINRWLTVKMPFKLVKRT